MNGSGLKQVDKVHLKYIDNVHIKVIADPSTIQELADHFTFFADNYRFHPKYKMKIWDGKIRLLNNLSGYIYAGLAKTIKKFCDDHGYLLTFDDELIYDNVSIHELKVFIDNLNIPEKYQVRDYQFDSIIKCIRSGRRTLVSPTSSGKSLMIYIITQWYNQHKSLIIVPTTGLVAQMESDFREYGYTGIVHNSIGGLSTDKDIEAEMVITTWQALNNGKNKRLKPWYEQFGCVVGDECHGAKATSLIQILSSLSSCKYRFGTTGTLDGTPLNETTIEGLFGPKYKAVSTKQLMDEGYVSTLKIKCIVLRYDEQTSKNLRGATYQEEIDFLVNNEKRNKFLTNLTMSLKGNRLLFFRIIDHGKKLHDLLSESNSDKVFYIDGSVSATDRESIRHSIEDEENAILIASLGTTSTGVSINRLNHMIAASPSKSKIKVLQSIGRVLRMHPDKKGAILYDIVDNLSCGKSHENFTLKHFVERCSIYDSEQFDYELFNVKLK